MKASPHIVLVAIMAAFLTSCSTTSIQIACDYDEKAAFSALKAYDWQPVGQVSSEEEFALKRVRRKADEEMEIKGYAKMAGSPDFLISAQIHTIREIKDWRYGRAHGGEGYSQFYEEGRLVLDFLDAATKEPIWRGSATGLLINSPDPEVRDRDTGEAVKGILENFPPRG